MTQTEGQKKKLYTNMGAATQITPKLQDSHVLLYLSGVGIIFLHKVREEDAEDFPPLI